MSEWLRVLAYLFALPVVELVLWSLLLAVSPATARKNAPYIVGFCLALGCALAVVIIYNLPRSQIAYEGDEADPLGFYILALTINAIGGAFVAVVLWMISLVLRGVKARA